MTTLSSLQAPSPVSKQQGALQNYREVKPSQLTQSPRGSHEAGYSHGSLTGQSPRTRKRCTAPISSPHPKHTPSPHESLCLDFHLSMLLPLAHSSVFCRACDSGHQPACPTSPTSDRKALCGSSVKGRPTLQNRARKGELRCRCDYKRMALPERSIRSKDERTCLYGCTDI